MDIICGKSSGQYDIEGALSYKRLQCFTERHREENVTIDILFLEIASLRVIHMDLNFFVCLSLKKKKKKGKFSVIRILFSFSGGLEMEEKAINLVILQIFISIYLYSTLEENVSLQINKFFFERAINPYTVENKTKQKNIQKTRTL